MNGGGYGIGTLVERTTPLGMLLHLLGKPGRGF
jgi:hypothetical protein